MPTSVFISYSRRNLPYAERLQLDLRRAGVDAWRDLSDIAPGAEWEQRIRHAMEERSHLVLLASPEAAVSEWVGKELAEASRLGKTVVPLRLAGRGGSLPTSWERWNMIDRAALDYWGAVRKLTEILQAPVSRLPSLVELLNARNGTVADAARELTGTQVATTAAGRAFLQLPVAPSAYGMTWLFAPAEALLRWPSSIAILFNFTSDHSGTRHLEALDHWSAQLDQASEPWLVMVEGPVNREKSRYELNAGNLDEWSDSIDVGQRAIEQFVRQRDRVGYYFNALVPLAFEIGLRTTMASDCRRVYHFNPNATGAARYELAFDGWR